MGKPLFFTAMMALFTALTQTQADAASPAADPQSSRPCPGGTTLDPASGKCVRSSF